MTDAPLMIEPATHDDLPAIWEIVAPVFRAGETYGVERDIGQDGVARMWLEAADAGFLARRAGKALGTYYLRANGAGGGAHVCNCGYITAAAARGQGVARAMCAHSQDEARRRGYKAMQFNKVVETNTAAVALWQDMGFEIVGTVPQVFDHPEHGLVGAHIMYKWLA